MSERLTKATYTEDALARARQSALDWLQDHDYGYPRTVAQEKKNSLDRSYELYDHEWEAPPIFGYDQLAEEGLALRVFPDVVAHDEARAHFIITEAGRALLRSIKGGERG